MKRFLAVDYGTRHIGLAVGADDGTPPGPVGTLRGTGDVVADAEATARAMDEHAADEAVVGLPLNMDDSEGPQAKLVRGFAAALESASGCTVHLVDERLSSIAAQDRLVPAELTRKKRKRREDAVAAMVILETFLSLDDVGNAGRSSDEEGGEDGA